MNGDLTAGGGLMPRVVMNRLRLGAGAREDSADRYAYD
jgi:hypothetical protein